MNRIVRSIVLGTLALLGAHSLCGEVRAQTGSPSMLAVDVDGRRAQRVFEESASKATVFQVLSQSLVVRGESDRAGRVAVDLYAVRVRGGKVIAKHRSAESFAVEAGRVARVPESALPSQSWFGEGQLADPDGLVTASKGVPEESAVTKAMDYVINGVFPDKPIDWREREMVYLVAIPACDGSSKACAGSDERSVVINHEEQYSVVTNPLLVVYPANGRDR